MANKYKERRRWKVPRERMELLDYGIIGFGILLMPPFMATIGGLWVGLIVYGAGKGKLW